MTKDFFSGQNIGYAPLPENDGNYGNDVLQSVTALQIGFGAEVLRSDRSGFWLGAKVFADAPFSVDMSGNVIASSLTVTGGTITGATFQTAVSGKRVVISGATNSLTFFDAAGQVIGIGTEASRAIDIVLNSTINNGIFITSAQSGNGFYYSNTANVAGRGIYIEMTNTGSNNSNTCIELQHDGHYYAQYIQSTNAAGGIIIDNAGSLRSLYIIHSGGSSGINIDQSGAGKSIEVTHTGSAKAMEITSTSTSQTDPAIHFSKTHVNEVVRISSNVNSSSKNTGIYFDMTNAGAGFAHAFQFEIATHSPLVNAAVGGAQDYKIRVLVDGVTRFIPTYAS